MAARFFTRGRVATWALLPLAMLAMGCMFSPDHLILFPPQGTTSSIGGTRRTLPFAGGELEIWTARSGGGWRLAATKPAAHNVQRNPPNVYVLRFYGNADRADPNVVPEAADWSPGTAEFWGVNYPGYGGSTGPATLTSIGPAALAAFDALQAEAGARPILVYGTSLGTSAALHVAAHRPVAGVILQNPPPLRQIVLRQFGWWNLWLVAGPLAARIPAALDSVANAQTVRARGVFLLAENDDMVKPKYQRLVVAAYAGEKRVITQRGAVHNEPLDGATTAELREAVAWMVKK